VTVVWTGRDTLFPSLALFFFPSCFLPPPTPLNCWMKNTGVSSNVCFTILVLPVSLDEEYWSFQYFVFYNTNIISIVG